jgi:hypothetical protein
MAAAESNPGCTLWQLTPGGGGMPGLAIMPGGGMPMGGGPARTASNG